MVGRIRVIHSSLLESKKTIDVLICWVLYCFWVVSFRDTKRFCGTMRWDEAITADISSLSSISCILEGRFNLEFFCLDSSLEIFSWCNHLTFLFSSHSNFMAIVSLLLCLICNTKLGICLELHFESPYVWKSE